MNGVAGRFRPGLVQGLARRGFAQRVVRTSLTLRVSVILVDISHEILTRSVSEVFHKY
jgi:hypothetical protein